jgi:hypothetical protein
MRGDGDLFKLPLPGARRRRTRRRPRTLEKRLEAIEKELRRLAEAAAEGPIDDELKPYWRMFERLRRYPTEKNASAAKRAYRFLAKRYHPDHGGNHHDFLRLKDAYDRALAVWRQVSVGRARRAQ